jgi:hypothetical protein
MPTYRRNHYVPEWYQYRFFPGSVAERKFFYLDLHPETKVSPGGHRYTRNALLRWGPPTCFCQDDLYTTKYGNFESTEIEQHFFGKVDTSAQSAVDYFANFQHPSADGEAYNTLLSYMSLQKLRTPKGMAYLASLRSRPNKNQVLLALRTYQNLYCAIWTECIWSIADASTSRVKFLLSDHPVTVYNHACFPASKWCEGANDPDIRLSATHTLFPLSLEKVLIFTNLSWLRNPYMNPLQARPNPDYFRAAMFNFMEIQTGRTLSAEEVNEINYIIKQRAYRYVAAAEEDWLYPERHLRTQYWDRLGYGYLLMPDPRSTRFGGEMVIGYKDGKSDAFDAYGRKPWQKGYDSKAEQAIEWDTYHAFQGEFARVFGSRRRGISYQGGSLDDEEDSADYHKYHLQLEGKFKPKGWKGRRGR